MPNTVDHLNTTVSRWSPRQLAQRGLLSCVPRRRLLESLPGTEAIYLTFDDGPHPEYTPRVLDVLAEYHAQATFFVVGQQCERYPDLVRRISAEGHAIGNHTYSHVKARDVSSSNYIDEVMRTNNDHSITRGKAMFTFSPTARVIGRVDATSFVAS